MPNLGQKNTVLTRPSLLEWFGVAAGLFCAHFLLFTVGGFLLFLSVRFLPFIFGTKSIIPWGIFRSGIIQMIVDSWFSTFVWAMLFSLAVCAFCFKQKTSRKYGYSIYFSIGFFLYAVFHLAFYIKFPGLFIKIPLISKIPFSILILSVIIIEFLALYFGKRFLNIKPLCIVVLILIFLCIPHGIFRNLQGPSAGNKDKTKCVYLVLDSARYDKTCEISKNKVQLGFSHFQATRKQYHYLLNDNLHEAGKLLFLPRSGELIDADLPKNIWTNELVFLLDEGGTVNRSTIDFGDIHQKSPSLGLVRSFFSNSITPVSLWFENFTSPVETVNPVSNRADFFSDVSRELSSHQLVFAHTCWIQDVGLYKIEELIEFRGWKIIWDIPEHYRVGRGDGNLYKSVYNFKLGYLLEKSDILMRNNFKKYSKFCGVVTSDHGQNFNETRGNIRTNIGGPSHGFNSSPSCAWIPVIFYGGGMGINNRTLSWRDFRIDISKFIKKAPEETVVFQSNKYKIHQMGYAFAIPGSKEEAAGLPGVNSVMKRIRSDPNGLSLDIPEHELFPCYYLFGWNEFLLTINPTNLSGDYVVELWRVYECISRKVVSKETLKQARFDLLEFNNVEELGEWINSLPSHASS